MDRAADPRPDRLLGGYELVDTFVDGVLYGVRHGDVEGPLALTLLPPGVAGDVGRLARLEVARRALSAAAADGVAPVVDLGHDGERAYVVERVVGVPLARVLRERGALPVRDALEVAQQIAAALAHAHGAGLAHGALAPTTIWINADRRVLVGGFLGGAAGVESAGYVAPERLLGDAADPAADVFALGLVLFEMVEGRSFLAGPDAVRERLLATKGPLLPRFSRIAPAGFAGLVARMIRRKASERPSAAAVREEIARCLARLSTTGTSARVVIDTDLAPGLDDDERPTSPTPAPCLRRVVTSMGTAGGRRLTSRRPPPRAITHHASEGAAIELSVRADDPDDGDAVSYAWRIDGRSAGSGPHLRFVAPPAAVATAHMIEVTVADRAGVRARPSRWEVAVAPRMTEADVREWLQRYASAWHRADVATLRLYGIDADAAALRRRVRRAHDRRVAIANETIRTWGPYADVAFDRLELDDGQLVESVHESLALAKRADGFIALRQPAGTALAPAAP